MSLTKDDINEIVYKIMTGTPTSDACEAIFPNQTSEEFSRIMHEAIFDVWIRVGDSGFNRQGYREAFDVVEDYYFPKKEKQKKEYFVNEHLPFDEYF